MGEGDKYRFPLTMSKIRKAPGTREPLLTPKMAAATLGFPQRSGACVPRLHP